MAKEKDTEEASAPFLQQTLNINSTEEKNTEKNTDRTDKKFKVFFSYLFSDSIVKELVGKVKEKLLKDVDFLIFESQSEELLDITIEQVKQADCYFLFISSNYLSSAGKEFETICQSHQNNSLKDVFTISIESNSEQNAEEIANKIKETLERVNKGNESKSRRDASKKSIDKIVEKLREREADLDKKAKTWRKLSWMPFVLCFIIFLCFGGWVLMNDNVFQTELVLYLTISAITILLTFFLIFSRYSFTLAKAYMNESTKIADRIHAIKFGQLFIEVFNTRVDKADFLEAFKQWNWCEDSSFAKMSPKEAVTIPNSGIK